MSTAAGDYLQEPALEFRYGQRSTAPHFGLSVFGPFDADAPSRIGTVTHAVVGTSAGIALLGRFLDRIRQPVHQVYGDPDIVKKSQLVWPTFPGLEVAFSCGWPAAPAWKAEVQGPKLHDFVQNRDAHLRAFNVCNEYLAAIKTASDRDERLSVVICVVPDEIWDNCRPQSRVFGGVGEKPSASEVKTRRTQTHLFGAYDTEPYQYSVDFRRQLKARSMEFGIPLQLVRESTLRLGDAAWGDRTLTPLSDRAWNLAVALYYKAGGKPWRLTTAREGVCYIGTAFRRAELGQSESTACCAAQMFLDSGDGVVFRGEFGPWWSPERKQFILGREGAKELLAGILETYQQQGGKTLREVFIHSRSRISRDEYQGYLEACPPGVKVVGVRVRRDFDAKLFREGSYPVLRGTTWTLFERGAFLWASGFKPELLTYDGWEVPAPLRIDLQHGEADIATVCRDILGLTKLNYNACKLADGQPVTVGFSDAVGEILIGNPHVRGRKPNFRFYI